MTSTILDHGADPSGKTLSTLAIQKCIDLVHQNGGGLVIVPSGTYIAGTLHLKSYIDFHLMPGAVIKASEHLADYPKTTDVGHNKDRQPYHWIYAEGQTDLSISGKGKLDGSGPAFWHEEPSPSGWFREKSERPSPMIEFKQCKNVRIEDIQVTNSPGWTIHLIGCDRCWVRGITIDNHLYGPNTDGIDINGSHDVIISDCFIKCGDDAIVLKTTPDSRTCERVTVTNCIIETNCVALKLGALESYKDMRQVTFSNCVVTRSPRAFGLYCTQGGTFEDIAVSNIVCDTTNSLKFNRAIHIDLRKWSPDSPMGKIRNVTVSNFIARSDGRILMTAQEGALLENITLSQIQLIYPKIDDPYPKGLDAGGAQFSNNNKEARAARGAVVAENIRNLVLSDLQITWPPQKAPTKATPDEPEFAVIWGRNLNDGMIRCPIARSNKLTGMPYRLKDSSIKVL